jgi:hypothetical protein
MSFGLCARFIGHDLSLALVTTSPLAQACVASFLTSESGGSPQSMWMNVYRHAYEQTRAALAPSQFQLRLEPCWN